MEDKAYETKLVAPTWLSGAVLRPPQAASASSASSFVNEPPPGSASGSGTAPASQPEGSRKWCGCDAGGQCVQCSFLHLQTAQNTAAAGTNPSPSGNANPSNSGNPWLTSAAMAMAAGKVTGEMTDMAGGSTDLTQSSARGARATPGGLLDLHSDTANSSDLVDGDHQGGTAAGGGGASNGDHQQQQQDSQNMWQSARLKADISMHQLFRQLLDAHVACLRIATPVDQLPRIEAQVAQASQVVAKYEVLGHNHMLVGEEKDELDQFMAHYVLLLCTFKEQLQQHVKVHAMEAVMACWDLEQSLLSLTGVSPGEGTGATMSDDEDDPGESDPSIYDGGFDAHDSGAFGPLIPTETERTLMERVRQELKNELKNGYKDRIVDVREEILRKRRAGKLPGDTTSVLKAWWHAHSKWPYPTEDEKARLVQETGLQLKQINNWFINQRKRNWHSNPSSNAALKTKRKR